MQTESSTTNLLTEREAALEYRRSVPSLRRDRLFNQGFPFIKLGRSVRYRRKDIEEYIDKLPKGGGKAAA